METTTGCEETEGTADEKEAGNEPVGENLLVDGNNVEAELDSQLGVEGGGRVGHEPMV